LELYREPWNGIDRQYRCVLSTGLYEFDDVIVNAMTECDAIDVCADWLQANGYVGLYKTSEEYEEMEYDHELYTCAGNSGIYIPLAHVEEFEIPIGEKVICELGAGKLNEANQIAVAWDDASLVRYLLTLADKLDSMLELNVHDYIGPYNEIMKSVAINVANSLGIPVPTTLKD
jgi:hypothetical protein